MSGSRENELQFLILNSEFLIAASHSTPDYQIHLEERYEKNHSARSRGDAAHHGLVGHADDPRLRADAVGHSVYSQRRVADLHRRSAGLALFPARSNQRRQLQQARSGVAIQ